MLLDDEQVAQLQAELGVRARVPGLTPIQVSVLAALRDAPLGLVSIRAVARRAGVSPTASARALEALLSEGLVRRVPTTLAAGSARPAELLHLNRRSPRWRRIAPLLAPVRAPVLPVAPREQRVPLALRHLFWNTAPAQLDVLRGGPYIARRLLRVMDFEGLAWGASNLSSADWLQAQKARGLDPQVRALAGNLAAAAGN
jgi:hypothetical protein